MIATVTVVLPKLAILLFLAFLGLLFTLGKIAGAVARGGEGGSPGCLGGCGLFGLVVLLSGLGIAGFAVFTATVVGVTAVEHNPIESIEVLAPNTEHGEYGRHNVPVLLRIQTTGDHTETLRSVQGFLERHCDDVDEAFEHVSTIPLPEGTLFEVQMKLDRHDLEEINRELQAWNIEFGEGIRIDLDAGHRR